MDVNCLFRRQGGKLIVKSSEGEREGGDSSLLLTKALVHLKAQVFQVRHEEGLFLLPPEVSANGVGVRDETANFVKSSQRDRVARTDPGRERISLPHDESVVKVVDSEPCK